jgi:hypothetical protein
MINIDIVNLENCPRLGGRFKIEATPTEPEFTRQCINKANCPEIETRLDLGAFCLPVMFRAGRSHCILDQKSIYILPSIHLAVRWKTIQQQMLLRVKHRTHGNIFDELVIVWGV